MNMKFKHIVISAVVTLVVFSGVAAYAWPAYCSGQEKGEEYAGKKTDNLTKELGLTPEQEEKIKALKTEQREAKKQLMDKIQSKKAELKEELEKATTNRARINSIVKELSALMEYKLEQRVESVLSMREVLTPEQYEKFKEEKEHFKGKKGGWRKNKKNKYHKEEF
ncbi:MAG: Spy/CpxP family protein refolding chaperone [Candidatus Omnitrophica bacterium]|nr:Spy/CpxP family protein refolding chaperone [Candidatus Omnitrophota bacterium]MBU4590078.1 Spy/CpxP family protein refolding chaperone [Candidatus Omnitrophota bacterium]